MLKIETFQHCLIHNMQDEPQRARRRYRFLPARRMTKEREFFQTQADACLCGDTVLTRSMYRTDILCSHRVAVWYENNPVDMSDPWAQKRPPVLGPVIDGLPCLDME
jgi:hypothetical protein